MSFRQWLCGLWHALLGGHDAPDPPLPIPPYGNPRSVFVALGRLDPIPLPLREKLAAEVLARVPQAQVPSMSARFLLSGDADVSGLVLRAGAPADELQAHEIPLAVAVVAPDASLTGGPSGVVINLDRSTAMWALVNSRPTLTSASAGHSALARLALHPPAR